MIIIKGKNMKTVEKICLAIALIIKLIIFFAIVPFAAIFYLIDEIRKGAREGFLRSRERK